MKRERSAGDAGSALFQRIATSTLELVLALTRGASGALFSCETEGRLGLITSRGLDQRVMDTVTRLWNERRADILTDPSYYTSGSDSFLVFTCMDGHEPVCLLYADMAGPGFRLTAEELATFRSILVRDVSDPGPANVRPEQVRAYLVHTSPDDIERDRLLLLLERHEWNVSRVSRLTGMSRDTIYRRLRQYDVGREGLIANDAGTARESVAMRNRRLNWSAKRGPSGTGSAPGADRHRFPTRDHYSK